MKITEEEKSVLRGIGWYFVEEALKTKEYEDAYLEGCRTLSEINITGIETTGDKVYKITMCRPGLFIGSRGVLINSISKHLGIKISIEENIIPAYVFPLDVSDYY